MRLKSSAASAILTAVPTSAIGDCFHKTARDKADVVAVLTMADGSVSTFADLAGGAVAVQRALAASRIDRGAVVIAMVGNTPSFFSIVVACMEAGAALIPISQATGAELDALIAQSGAAALITDRPIQCLQGDAVREELVAGTVRVLRLRDPIDRPQCGASVVLKLTSGSTSIPKAAIASERHLINDGRHVVEAMGIGPSDVNATYIPLSHSYALGNVVMPLLCQGTSAALYPSFNPAQFLQDVAEARATVFPGVPFMFERIKSSDADRVPDCLRLLITAGARIERDVVSWFRDRLDRKVHSFYGSSETGGITYDDTEDVGDVVHLGRAMPETAVSIRPAEGDAAGRIFVKGNAVSSGYVRADDDAATSEFVDGGFLTGDLGHFDEKRQLILTGRVSPSVNVAGRKVDPGEVEECLMNMPGVAAATVVGVACDARGQQLAAFVVRSDAELTVMQVRTACAATLSPHKIPRRVVFIDSLPLTERGKVDRGALQRLADSTPDF
jgi:acyl-CoA synthetase (AMP-forming)/AMP-acid ligase II